jgi:hypothetical protein
MMEIEERVLLLGIYKRKEGESLNDVLMILEDAGVFSYKEGKKKLKLLKEDGYIEDDKLTVVGINKAKEIENEFKL